MREGDKAAGGAVTRGAGGTNNQGLLGDSSSTPSAKKSLLGA
jgi:hypothetical protein